MAAFIRSSFDLASVKIVVQKFGGTSVQDVAAIRRSATFISKAVADGYGVVVVVSAMGGVTSQLSNYISECINEEVSTEDLPSCDMVLSSGEQVVVGLMSLVLHSVGLGADSFLGWQIPIITDGNFSSAHICDIDVSKLLACLEKGQVCIVAGFQGVNNSAITTLGRGGSDITAVALSAALSAERCDIYTDVEGVYTSDPRVIKNVAKIPLITYQEMLEMSSLGAKVLHSRAVELAMKYGVRLQILSSFKDEKGTFLVKREEKMAIKESHVIMGVTCIDNEILVILRGVKRVAQVFDKVAKEGIYVNTIVRNYGENNVSFTIHNSDEFRVKNIFSSNIEIRDNIAIISILGAGMLSNSGVASTMFDVLEEKGIQIFAITTSEIRLSVVIDLEFKELAMCALHSRFGLDNV